MKELTAKESSNALRADELINRAYPDTKAKKKTAGRRKSMGGMPSGAMKNKNMTMLGEMLQKKMKRKGPKGDDPLSPAVCAGENESKSPAKRKHSPGGRRKSIAAMLESKLGEGVEKSK